MQIVITIALILILIAWLYGKKTAKKTVTITIKTLAWILVVIIGVNLFNLGLDFVKDFGDVIKSGDLNWKHWSLILFIFAAILIIFDEIDERKKK